MSCDFIVIGAGHNGLACAAYLAKAGQKVLVQGPVGALFTRLLEALALVPMLGDFNDDLGQAIVEVFPELALRDCLSQVAVGGGQPAHVDR